jgi:hypothetical protein
MHFRKRKSKQMVESPSARRQCTGDPVVKNVVFGELTDARTFDLPLHLPLRKQAEKFPLATNTYWPESHYVPLSTVQQMTKA